jgi:hypothetical protein
MRVWLQVLVHTLILPLTLSVRLKRPRPDEYYDSLEIQSRRMYEMGSTGLEPIEFIGHDGFQSVLPAFAVAQCSGLAALVRLQKHHSNRELSGTIDLNRGTDWQSDKAAQCFLDILAGNPSMFERMSELSLDEVQQVMLMADYFVCDEGMFKLLLALITDRLSTEIRNLSVFQEEASIRLGQWISRLDGMFTAKLSELKSLFCLGKGILKVIMDCIKDGQDSMMFIQLVAGMYPVHASYILTGSDLFWEPAAQRRFSLVEQYYTLRQKYDIDENAEYISSRNERQVAMFAMFNEPIGLDRTTFCYYAPRYVLLDYSRIQSNLAPLQKELRVHQRGEMNLVETKLSTDAVYRNMLLHPPQNAIIKYKVMSNIRRFPRTARLIVAGTGVAVTLHRDSQSGIVHATIDIKSTFNIMKGMTAKAIAALENHCGDNEMIVNDLHFKTVNFDFNGTFPHHFSVPRVCRRGISVFIKVIIMVSDE